VRPILFHTIVDPMVREEVLKAQASSHDFLNTFVSPLEQELGIKAEPRLHRTHGMKTASCTTIASKRSTLRWPTTMASPPGV
jgi:regulator of PEP synthase PpsR (kinase-PPPase family)